MNANHVIFVAPLESHLQYYYEASRQQCVGRVLRFGQEKTVYIYDFLTLNTFDVDMYQARTGKKLLMRDGPGGTKSWEMVEGTQMTKEEKEQNWRSGYHHQFADGPSTDTGKGGRWAR